MKLEDITFETREIGGGLWKTYAHHNGVVLNGWAAPLAVSSFTRAFEAMREQCARVVDKESA